MTKDKKDTLFVQYSESNYKSRLPPLAKCLKR